MAQDKNGIATRHDVTTLGRIDEFEVPTYDGEPQIKCVQRVEIAKYGRRNFKVDGEYEKNQLVKFEDIHYHYIPTPEPEPNVYILESIEPVAVSGTNGRIGTSANSTIGYIFKGKLKNSLSEETVDIPAGKIYVENVDNLINPNSRFSYTIGDYAISGEDWYGNKLNVKSSYNNTGKDMAFGLVRVNVSYEVQPNMYLYGSCVMYVTQDGNVVYYHYKNLYLFYSDNYDKILANGSNYAYITGTVEYCSSDSVSSVYSSATQTMYPYFYNPEAEHYKIYCETNNQRVRGENLGTTAVGLTFASVKCYSPVPDDYIILNTYESRSVFDTSFFRVEQEANTLSMHKRVTACTYNQMSYMASIDYSDPGLDTMPSGYDYGTTGPTYTRVNSEGACWYTLLKLSLYKWSGYTSGAQASNTSTQTIDGVLSARYRDENFEQLPYQTGDIHVRNRWYCYQNPQYEGTDSINNGHQDVCNENAWLTIAPNYTTSTTVYRFYATYNDSSEYVDSSGSSAKKYATGTLTQWRKAVYSYSGRVESYSVYFSTDQPRNQHELSIPYDKYGRNMSPFVGVMIHPQKGRKAWKNGSEGDSTWSDDDGTQTYDSMNPSTAMIQVSYPQGNGWLQFIPYNDPSGTAYPTTITHPFQYVENLYSSSEKWWGLKLYPSASNLTQEAKVITLDIHYTPEVPRNTPIQSIVIQTAFTITHETQGAVMPTLSMPSSLNFRHYLATSQTVTVSSNVTNWSCSSSTPSWLTVTKLADNSGVNCSLTEYTNRYATSERTATAATYITNDVGSAFAYTVVKQRPPYLFELTGGTSNITYSDDYHTGGTINIGYNATSFTLAIASRGVTTDTVNYGYTAFEVNAYDIYDGSGGPIGSDGTHTLTAGTITVNGSGAYTSYIVPLMCPVNTSSASEKTYTVTVWQKAQDDPTSPYPRKIEVTVIQAKAPEPERQPLDFLGFQWYSSGGKYYIGLSNSNTSRPLKVTSFWYYDQNPPVGSSHTYRTYQNEAGGPITIQPGTTVSTGIEITDMSNPWTVVLSLDGLPSDAPSWVTVPGVSWAD